MGEKTHLHVQHRDKKTSLTILSNNIEIIELNITSEYIMVMDVYGSISKMWRLPYGGSMGWSNAPRRGRRTSQTVNVWLYEGYNLIYIYITLYSYMMLYRSL